MFLWSENNQTLGHFTWVLQQWSLLDLKLKNYRDKCGKVHRWNVNQNLDWKDKLFSEELHLESLDLLAFCPKLLSLWSCGALSCNQQQVKKKNMLFIVLNLLQGELFSAEKYTGGVQISVTGKHCTHREEMAPFAVSVVFWIIPAIEKTSQTNK